jgi:regulator of protease activity HflC (stomatin/prohibitin superfamily)
MESPFIFLCLVGAILLLAALFVFAGIRIVPEGRRLSVYRFGEYMGDKGPGIVFLIPIIDRGVLMEVGDTDRTADND